MLRVLLDAHISSRAVAAGLRSDGHDVLALAEHTDLAALADPDVLELAASERRILVTHDVKDFPPLLREWAEGARSHSGCVVVHGIRSSEFGRVLRGLRRLFAGRPDPEAWRDLPIVLSPVTADAEDERPRGN